MSPRLLLILLAIFVIAIVVSCHFAEDSTPEPSEQSTTMAALHWGNAWARNGNWDKAIEGYTQAIEEHPDLAEGHICRGRAWESKGDFEKALEDYNKAIILDHVNGSASKYRRDLWCRLGEWGKVLDEYSELIEKKPNDPYYWNNRAWLRATCPDARFRDGHDAVRDAYQACELTHWRDLLVIDTLAAAYAESGDFEKAIEYQNKVVTRSMSPKIVDQGVQLRLELYLARQAYREELYPLELVMRP